MATDTDRASTVLGSDHLYVQLKYLNIASVDYANLSHNNAEALRAVGVKCDDFCLTPHPFGYTNQSKKITTYELKKIFRQYDVIQIMHSDVHLLSYVHSHPHLIVYHTGTFYREFPNQSNKAFNGVVKYSVTDQTEFMELGAKNLSYLAPHVSLKPTYKPNLWKTIVGHYPSNAEVKGTKQIREMLSPYTKECDVRINTETVSHEQNLARIADCHIYVELFKPVLNSKVYGCFGVTAFEAAALGCKVITQNLFPDVYESAYGKCHFHIANTPDQFTKAIESLKNLSPEELSTPPEFYDQHSIENTGKRILKITQ